MKIQITRCSIDKEIFYDITANYHCYKTFFSSLVTMRQNKLECLSLATGKALQASLMFVSKA